MHRNVHAYRGPMAPGTTAEQISKLAALLADPTRSEILCSLMDGRAHTGSELARHVGVAASTVSEHLSKLLDADMIAVEAQGRHRYWRLANQDIAGLLETLGANATTTDPPRAPADLAHARTCYDHLAGELAVVIYQQLLADRHLADTEGHLKLTPSGLKLLDSVGVNTIAISDSKRPKVRPCLDWTQRRHHLAGAAGKELLAALTTNDWIAPGGKPRSIRVTETGRTQISAAFNLPRT